MKNGVYSEIRILNGFTAGLLLLKQFGADRKTGSWERMAGRYFNQGISARRGIEF